MDPPIEHSVVKLNEQCFRLGSSMICEKSTAKGQSGILSTWQDNGKTFILRQQTDYDRTMPPSTSSATVIHEAGGCAEVWLFGDDTFCKVKAWCEGLESEKATIDFVKTCCPHIPVPEVIFSWVDRDWSRSFTIIKRVPGKTLNEQWPSLNPSQRSDIANKIAEYCNDLSKVTSHKFETVTKKGVNDDLLNDKIPAAHPDWKPRLIGPLSHSHFTKFLQARTGKIEHPIPSFGTTFHLYHSDLGPTNIMISDDGKITGIIDWESVAFYPRFWVASKPVLAGGFLLDPDYVGEDIEVRGGWAEILRDALIAQGFEYSHDIVWWWRSMVMAS